MPKVYDPFDSFHSPTPNLLKFILILDSNNESVIQSVFIFCIFSSKVNESTHASPIMSTVSSENDLRTNSSATTTSFLEKKPEWILRKDYDNDLPNLALFFPQDLNDFFCTLGCNKVQWFYVQEDESEVYKAFQFVKSTMDITNKFADTLPETISIAKKDITLSRCSTCRRICKILFILKQHLDANNFNPFCEKVLFFKQNFLQAFMNTDEIFVSVNLLYIAFSVEILQLKAFQVVSNRRNPSKRPTSPTSKNFSQF